MAKYQVGKNENPKGTLIFTGKPSYGTKIKIYKTRTHYQLQIVAADNGRQVRLEPVHKADLHYYIEQNS